MSSGDSTMPAGLARMILGRHFGPLKEKIESFQIKRLGRHGFANAHAYFSALIDLNGESFDEFVEVFNFYILYAYRGQTIGGGSSSEVLNSRPTAAEEFLATSAKSLLAVELELLKAQVNSALSFWEVVRIRGRTHVDLIDLVTKEHVTIEDHGLASSGFVGGICFASVMKFRGEHHFTFCAPLPLPSHFKIHLLEELEDIFGADFYVKPATVTKIDPYFVDDLIACYVDLAMLLLHPQPPSFCNTDGDPLELGEVTFRTQIALSEVVSALKILNPEGRVDGPDAEGRFSVDWLSESKNKSSGLEMILLAVFRISDGKIVAEVNSRKRAKKAKDKLDEIFGSQCKYVKAKYIAKDKANLPQFKSKESEMTSLKQGEDLDKLSPEVRAQMMDHVHELMNRKSIEWVDTPVPMLGNKTPRDAVRTAQGAEKVDALLSSFEDFQRTRHASNSSQIVGMNIELIRSLLLLDGKQR